MIGLSVRDRKGREVAATTLYDHDFTVETSPHFAVVLRSLKLTVTGKGRGPYTWHIGEASGVATITSRLRPGDSIGFSEIRLFLGGAS